LTLEARATAAVAMQSAHSALCFDWQTFNIKSQLRHIHIDSGAVNGSLVDLTLRGIARMENFSFLAEKRETASRFLSKDREREVLFRRQSGLSGIQSESRISFCISLQVLGDAWKSLLSLAISYSMAQ
jgi:hypothetical protein